MKKQSKELLSIGPKGFKKKLIDSQGFQLGDLRLNYYTQVVKLMSKHKDKLYFIPGEELPGVKVMLKS